MSLKQIPMEPQSRDERVGTQKKHFNPGQHMKKDGFLKTICLRLVGFVNRGSRYTSDQIDDLITELQHGILFLQRKKIEAMQKRSGAVQKKRRT